MPRGALDRTLGSGFGGPVAVVVNIVGSGASDERKSLRLSLSHAVPLQICQNGILQTFDIAKQNKAQKS